MYQLRRLDRKAVGKDCVRRHDSDFDDVVMQRNHFSARFDSSGTKELQPVVIVEINAFDLTVSFTNKWSGRSEDAVG